MYAFFVRNCEREAAREAGVDGGRSGDGEMEGPEGETMERGEVDKGKGDGMRGGREREGERGRRRVG